MDSTIAPAIKIQASTPDAVPVQEPSAYQFQSPSEPGAGPGQAGHESQPATEVFKVEYSTWDPSK